MAQQGPLDLAALIGQTPYNLYGEPEFAKWNIFIGALIPTLCDDGIWRYSCPNFGRDDNGLGICAIYDNRPSMCEGFPYGKTIPEFERCAWNVEIIDA